MDINYVYLADERADDSNIDPILAFPAVEGINLSSSRITDKSLQRLSRFRQLKVLQLFHVETVTPSGIAEFQRRVPNCHVWR